MELPDRTQAKSWEGKDVVDRDGQRLGRCVGVFADTATGVPEWLHVDVEGHVRSFVPAIDATERDGSVRVPFTREAVVGAPAVGDDEQLSKAEEIELYTHYGVPVERDEGSVLPAGAPAAGTGGTDPVVGTSDRTSTAAESSSGASTAVAEADSGAPRSDGDSTTVLTPTASGATQEGLGTSSLSDESAVEGAAVTPETGHDLPVLDPAAASTPVPEDQVTYVDEPEHFTDAGSSDDAAPAAAAPAAAPEPPAVEQPRPALRRVPPASPPTAQPAPSGSDLSALTPLGAVAGVAAAVALVLQARERRQRRRNSAAARAGRLGGSLRAGSASALAGVSEAAELTRRSASTATGAAAKAAARQQRRAAAAARRQRAQSAAALTAASKTAAAQKEAATRAAAAQKKAAARAAAQQRAAAAASLSSVTSRGSSKAGAVTAVPRKAAKRGRKLRRSLARKIWNTVLLGTAGGGYVLGAKAGRQRYDELSQVAAAVAGNPKVQAATETLTDPERRTDLLLEVQQQAGSLVGRRAEPRS